MVVVILAVWDNKQENYSRGMTAYDCLYEHSSEWQNSPGFLKFWLFVTIFAVLEW